MYTIPTLRDTLFALALYGIGLAMFLTGAGAPGFLVALGVVVALGLLSGIAHVLAIRQLPPTLTNASEDQVARRQAFLASSAGKLHFGVDLAVWLTPLAMFLPAPLTLPWPPLALPMAYSVVRHTVALAALLQKSGLPKRA